LTYEYEMALTQSDFMRLLPVAVGHAEFLVHGNCIESQGDAPAWRITLEPRPERRIALLSVPALGVIVEIADTSAEYAARFIERFLLGFQRAGG
jgi:hypothetical protein